MPSESLNDVAERIRRDAERLSALALDKAAVQSEIEEAARILHNIEAGMQNLSVQIKEASQRLKSALAQVTESPRSVRCPGCGRQYSATLRHVRCPCNKWFFDGGWVEADT